MPVFYQKEKSKFGTTSGTIIAFPVDLISTDPNDADNVAKLPAGYLRCDGSVQSAIIYPTLAEVLGTGDASVFRQPDKTLNANQFQLPDLRSKYLKATATSNQGLINNHTTVNASGQTVSKAGIGVSITTNVGNSATVSFQGLFRIPPQTANLLGNLSFTKPKYTEEEVVDIKSMAPHVHYTNTSRCRIKPKNLNNIYLEDNYYVNATTIGVNNWFDATGQPSEGGYLEAQPACNFYLIGQDSNAGNLLPTLNGCSIEYWEVCYSGCSGMIQNCLVPNNKTYTFESEAQAEQTCLGFIKTNFTIGIGGSISGSSSDGYNSTNNNVGSDDIPQSGDNGYSHTAKLNNVLPFDPSADTDIEAAITVSNVVQITDDYNYEDDPTLHKHTINYTVDPTSYTMTTGELFIPTDGLKATISISPENTVALDDMVPPFTIVEYLIKI
jgi:hypothetical protein